jgi:hypothetical protein
LQKSNHKSGNDIRKKKMHLLLEDVSPLVVKAGVFDVFET